MPEQGASVWHEVVQCGATILWATTTSGTADLPQILWAKHDEDSCRRPFLLYVRTESDEDSRVTRELLSANVEASYGGWCEHALQMSDCKVLPDEADLDDQQDIDVFLALVRELETYKWYHEHVVPEEPSHPINVYDAGINNLRETSAHKVYGGEFQAPARTATEASVPESMISDHSSSDGKYSDYMVNSSVLFPGYDDRGPPEAGTDDEQRDLGHMSDVD